MGGSIKGYIFKCSLLLGFLITTPSFAQIPTEGSKAKIPAAWVWEVTGQGRTVYLAGELHWFRNVREEDVDFDFGYAIFNMVSKAYREAVSASPSLASSGKKLSEILSPATWKTLELRSSEVISTMNYPSEKAKKMHEDLMTEFDRQSATFAEISITNLAGATHAFRTKSRPVLINGLSLRLFEKDNRFWSTKKLAAIEPDTSLDDAWHQTCGGPEYAEKMISMALALFEPENAKYAIPVGLQRIFKENDATAEERFLEESRQFPEYEISNKCDVLPRNNLWMKNIDATLATAGPPVAYFVGVGHLLGDQGIVNTLKNDGRFKVRRIYSLDKN